MMRSLITLLCMVGLVSVLAGCQSAQKKELSLDEMVLQESIAKETAVDKQAGRICGHEGGGVKVAEADIKGQMVERLYVKCGNLKEVTITEEPGEEKIIPQPEEDHEE